MSREGATATSSRSLAVDRYSSRVESSARVFIPSPCASVAVPRFLCSRPIGVMDAWDEERSQDENGTIGGRLRGAWLLFSPFRLARTATNGWPTLLRFGDVL